MLLQLCDFALATRRLVPHNRVKVMLADAEIKELVESGVLKIKPFDARYVEPASYDIRAGRVLVAKRGIVDLMKEPVVLRHGDWAELESLESLELPPNIAATVGLRSSLTRRGLDWFGGPQIDPGYQGKIYTSVFNAAATPIEIIYGVPIATVIFYRLSKDATPYDGKYQRQFTFPEEDVERMLKMETHTLSDVITSVGLLEQTVERLTRTSEKMATDMEWVKRLLFAILIAIVVGVGQQLLSKWFH